MSKKLLTNVALLIISLAISVAAAEVLLRGYAKMQRRYTPKTAQNRAEGWIRERSQDAFDREGEFYGKWQTFAKMRYSAYLGYWPASNIEGSGYRTNNLGFRNDADIADKKADDEVRVFMVGGSTAWGAGVRQEDTYAVILQDILQKALPNKRVSVWIAAVGAYLSTHERIVTVNKLARLEPDAIVQMSGWNDTYAGYRGFSVMDDRWDYTSSAAVLARFHRLFVYDEDNARMMDPGPPTRKDHSLALFYFADQLYYAQRLKNARRPHQAVVDDLLTNVRIAKAAIPPEVPYVFALQPTIYATSKTLSEWETQLREKNEAATPAYGAYNAAVYSLYRAQLEEKLTSLKVDFIDLDPAIADEARSVFTDHVHLGDRGNRMLAERLAQRLQAKLTP